MFSHITHFAACYRKQCYKTTVNKYNMVTLSEAHRLNNYITCMQESMYTNTGFTELSVFIAQEH